MSTPTARRRRLMALLVLPFLLVLAGCGRLTADFTIRDVDTLDVAMDLAIDSSYVEGVYGSPEEMCASTQEEQGGSSWNAAEWVPYEEDSLWGCRIEGTVTRENFGSDMTLTEENGELHLVMGGGSATSEEDLALFEGEEFEFRVTFTFPGEVLESAGGQIDGNTVTYTDIAEFSQGIDIRAESGDGFGWIIVVLIVLVIGFLLLVGVGIGAFFLIRSRRSRATAGTGAPAAMAGAGSGAAAGWGQGSPPAAPQGQQWGQQSPPAAPQGQQWGQTSPPAAPQSQSWGQQSPPAAPPGQPWDQQGQHAAPQPWDQGAPSATPQQGPAWGQQSPPAAPSGEPWGQGSAPSAPEGQQWGQQSPPRQPWEQPPGQDPRDGRTPPW